MKKQILIVEDEVIIAEDIKEALLEFGYEISAVVSSGEAAIAEAKINQPDIVLMDIFLEGQIDGIEAAQQIRSRFNIPILYLTANNNMTILERARISEPSAFIIKPFEKRELYTNIEIALHKHQVEKKLSHLNSVLKAIKNINQLIVRERKSKPLLKGVCDHLVESKSCHTAWITSRDSSGTFALAAHSGPDEEFKLLVEGFNAAKIPGCIKKALGKGSVLVTEVTASSCEKCPLFSHHKGLGSMAARLKYDNKIYGVLNVSIPPGFIESKEEKELIKEVADDIAFALNKIQLEKARKKLEEQLHTAAITDELTGIYNRRGFFTLAEQQHKLAIRTKRKMSLLYLDVDNLKIINDRFGHKTGDEALVETANVLKNTFRQSDIMARIGGDEFAVLLIEHQGGDFETVVTSNIKKKLQYYNEQGHHNYHLSLSMGMAHFDPEQPCSIGDLLIKADADMYEDKKYHKLYQLDEIEWSIPGQKRSKKRQYPRFEIQNYWSKLPGVDTCEIKNISLGGMCLKTFQKLPVKKIYNFRISPSINGGASFKGMVVWSLSRNTPGKKGDSKPIYEVGFKFIELSNPQENTLNQLISKISH